MADATAELERAAADIPLTRSGREVLERAAALAGERGASQVGAIDVLRAALASRGSRAGDALRALGQDPKAIESLLAVAPAEAGPPLRQLLVNANREAQVLGHYQVDSIHLLLALLYSDSPATAAALQQAGLTLYDLRRHLQLGDAPSAPTATSPRTRPDAPLRRKPLLSLRGVLGISPIFYGLVAMTLLSGAVLFFDLLPDAVAVVTIVFITSGWITSVCIHEFGHAAVAYLGGDRSVAASGYLTLDPLRYTNILGSVILPVVFLLLGGIALPGGAVYINHGALRSRAWSSLVSAAGPAGTLLFGLVVAVAYFVFIHTTALTATTLDFFAALATLAFFQDAALVLNLLPIPGLDGFGILRPWLPFGAQDFANRFGQLAIIGVFILLWNVAAARDAYFITVFTITDLLGIQPALVFVGLAHMRFA